MNARNSNECRTFEKKEKKIHKKKGNNKGTITNRNVDNGIDIIQFRKGKKKTNNKTDLWMKKVVNLKEIRHGVMRL